MGEKSLKKIVTFTPNYESPHMSEKQLREEFKSVFSCDDTNNNAFFDECDMYMLKQLCHCFEYFMGLFDDYDCVDFRNLGIARYIKGDETYVLFTTTTATKDYDTDEYTGLNEEVAGIVQVRKISKDEAIYKTIVDYTVTNVICRNEKENRPGMVTNLMLEEMRESGRNPNGCEFVSICKSNLRVTIDKYNELVKALRKLQDERRRKEDAGEKDNEKILKEIEKLEKNKERAQQVIKMMVVDIKNGYEYDKSDYHIPNAVKINEEEIREDTSENNEEYIQNTEQNVNQNTTQNTEEISETSSEASIEQKPEIITQPNIDQNEEITQNEGKTKSEISFEAIRRQIKITRNPFYRE